MLSFRAVLKNYFTLILNARLKPLAKNPPKGPMTEAKMDMKNAWIKTG